MRYTSRELYKILDVAYNELCFVKEELLIYKNDKFLNKSSELRLDQTKDLYHLLRPICIFHIDMVHRKAKRSLLHKEIYIQGIKREISSYLNTLNN